MRLDDDNPISDMQAHDKAYAQHPERKGSKPPAQTPMQSPDITIGGPASLPSKQEVDQMRQKYPETPLGGVNRTSNTI